MTATTHAPSPTAAVATDRPELDEAAAMSFRQALTADEKLGRAFIKGSVVGSVLVFLFCGGVSLLAGLGWAGAIGIGLFTAFWGGPGFGGMMGATVYYSYHSEDF
jgi:hypothetical protein